MPVGHPEMLAPCPSRALPCDYWSSRKLCFLSSIGRVPARLAAVTFSFSSASSEEDLQPKEAAPALNKNRFSTLLGSGIWAEYSMDTSCHGGALEIIEKDIDKLELVLVQSEQQSHGRDLTLDAVWETQSKLNTLNEELCRLQTMVELKEDSLNISLNEATKLKTILQDTQVQIVSLSLYKELNEGRQSEELLRLEKSAGDSLATFHEHFLISEAIKNVQEKVQDVWESIVKSQCSSVSLKLIEILQSEASLSYEALLMATKELEQEKGLSSSRLSKFEKSIEDLKDRDLCISRLQQELANANHSRDMALKEVSSCEAEVSSLQQKLISTERLLEKEREALRSARDGLEELDQALGSEESKVDDLFKEVSSLKAQLEQKERILQRLTDEAIKNKGLAETGRKHLDAFHQSEKKVEQLVMHCSALESQIKSRDMLLDEIKKEAFKSTEALKLAAQIKQDLNLTKQREVELTQDLERERLQIKDLRRDLMENTRAVRAELALKQAEKDMMDLTKELTFLKKGLQSRDEVIKNLEQKIEGNIHILRSASEDREAMRKMQSHIQTLESKLREFISVS